MSKRTHRTGARPSRALQSNPHPGGPDAGAAGHRQERLERILHEELQTFVRDAADPALHAVRLLSVDLTVDGGLARVGYVVEAPLADQARAGAASRDALDRARGFLRSCLASLLGLKRVPRLSFTFVGVQEPEASSRGGEPWRG